LPRSPDGFAVGRERCELADDGAQLARGLQCP